MPNGMKIQVPYLNDEYHPLITVRLRIQYIMQLWLREERGSGSSQFSFVRKIHFGTELTGMDVIMEDEYLKNKRPRVGSI